MSRQQNQRQQQQEAFSDEIYAQQQQQKKYVCTAPKPEVWDDYSDSVYKSLLRMAAAKDLKKSKKKKEHQKTKVGAIRITKIAIADIEVTLDKTRNFHNVKNERTGPGRKSNAEHAIHFYEHILERLQDRLSKLQNSNSIKDIATGDITTTDNTDGKTNVSSVIFQDYDITPIQNLGPKITPNRKGNAKTNEIKTISNTKDAKKSENKIIPNSKEKLIKTTPPPTYSPSTTSISTRKRTGYQRDEEMQPIIHNSENKKNKKKKLSVDTDDGNDHLDNDLGSPGSLFGRDIIANKNACVVCFDGNHHDQSDNPSNTTTLLNCSGCEYKFHVSCLRPAIDEVPKDYGTGSWKCPYCILQVEPKNSSTRKHAAKGVRLMARLRNRFDREKKQSSKQQQQRGANASERTPSAAKPAGDTIANDRGATPEDIDQNNQINDDKRQAEVDSSSVDSSKKDTNRDTRDSWTKRIETEFEKVNDHDNNTKKERGVEQSDTSDTNKTSADVTGLSKDDKATIKKELITENSTLQIESSDNGPQDSTTYEQSVDDQGDASTNSSAKKRINLELAKLIEAAAFSPSSSKRVKKKPRLYDPQVCAASSWKSDATIVWSTQSDEDETATPTVPTTESLSNVQKEAAKNVDYSITNKSERGNSTVSTEVFERKTMKGKNSSWCAFCHDDPDVVVCCFCACRVCFGKHNQGMLLLCDMCDDEYHTYCLQPPLSVIPATKWFCPSCSNSESKNNELISSEPVKGPGRPSKKDDPTSSEHVKGPGRPSKKEDLTSSEPVKGPGRPSKKEVLTSSEPVKGPGRPSKKEVLTSSEPVKGPGRPSKQGASTASNTAKVKNNQSESPTKKSITPVGSSSKKLNFQTPKIKESEEKNSSRSFTEKNSKEKSSDSRTKSSTSTEITDVPLVQPRKRGRPRKNPVDDTVVNKSNDSVANKKKVDVVPTKKPVEKPTASKTNDTKIRNEVSSIKSGLLLSNAPVLISRSGRMVKRTNFHDEIDEGEQHLRATMRSASFSQETTDVGSMSGAEEGNQKRQTKRSSNLVTETTSNSGKRGVQSKASQVQSQSMHDEIDETEEDQPIVDLLHESMPDSLISTSLPNVTENDMVELDFINQMQLSAEDIDAIAMQTVTDDHILHQVHASINSDSMALHIDEHEANLLSSFESSQIEREQQALQIPLMKDESPILHNSAVTAPEVNVAAISSDQALIDLTSISQREMASSLAASIPTVAFQSEDSKEGKDSAKLPRRKPGARECMQISRRFGVSEIPQKYMDILLDYCSRGKVEHLIRMRERLDEHARFLESQLAGLEVLVMKNGESDVVVPIASQMPGYKAQTEKDNADGFP